MRAYGDIYIDLDGYDEPALWLEPQQGNPVLLAERCRTHPIVWQAIVEKWGKR